MLNTTCDRQRYALPDANVLSLLFPKAAAGPLVAARVSGDSSFARGPDPIGRLSRSAKACTRTDTPAHIRVEKKHNPKYRTE